MFRFSSLAFMAFVAAMGLAAAASSVSATSSWSDASLITNGANSALTPQVAFDSGGNAIAVWVQLGGRTNHDLWTNRYTADSGWGTPVLLQNGVWWGASPQVVTDQNGNGLVVWTQSEAVNFSCCMRVMALPFGNTSGFGTVEPLDPAPIGTARTPRVSMNDFGNGMVVWALENGSSNRTIWSNRYTLGNGFAGAEMIETVPGESSGPVVAVDGGGKAIVIWHRYDGALWNLVAREHSPGVGWSAEVAMETAAEPLEGGAAVAFDRAGNAQVLWGQLDGANRTLWSRRYQAWGSWATAVRVARDSGSIGEFQLAADRDATFIAVWEQASGGYSSIWAARCGAGSAWDVPQLIESMDTGNAAGPRMAVDPSGSALVVWMQANSSQGEIWANRFQAGAGWRGAARVDRNVTDDNRDPAVAMDSRANGIAVWIRLGPTRGDAVAAVFDPLELYVEAPLNGTVTNSSVVRVLGITSPGATVAVNGAITLVEDDGSWSVDIPLWPGDNRLNVSASDSLGNLERILVHVTSTADYTSLLRLVESFSSQLVSTSAFLNATASNLSQLEFLMQSIEAQVAGLGADLAEARARLDALNNASAAPLAALSSAISEAENRTILLESRVSTAEAEASDLRAELDALAVAVAANETKIRQAVGDLNESTVQLALLFATMTQIEDRSNATAAELDALNSSLSGTQAEVTAARRELQDALRASDDAQAAAESAARTGDSASQAGALALTIALVALILGAAGLAVAILARLKTGTYQERRRPPNGPF